jgi:F-type H+-transporting ATPase subunit b
MNELFEQLGIDWKLFLSQIFNFFVLLGVLTFFVYKPLIKTIKERNKRIKDGLDKAEEADVRLKEIDNIGKEKIKDAEQQSIEIIKATENRAKVLDKEIQEKAEKKQKEINDLLRQSAKKQQEELNALVMKDAIELVKKVVSKTVELNPKEIDDKLIKKAASEVNEI